MDYIVLDYYTEKVIAYCETLQEAEQQKEIYIENCKRNKKCFDMYIYSMIA